VKLKYFLWIIFFLLASGAIAAKKCPIVFSANNSTYPVPDSNSIKKQIALLKAKLYFPVSTARFYKTIGYKLAWLAPDTVKTHVYDAMLLLDCIEQYGLNHASYHPQQLLYEELKKITEQWLKVSDDEKIQFDILLTDAILTFTNNIHFGRFNPEFSPARIDKGTVNGFSAVTVIVESLSSHDFVHKILLVQPTNKQYTDLQYHLHLLAGLYQCDCYDVPNSTMQKVAINLERLRWLGNGDKDYIQINIPSYSLNYYQKDTAYRFKVIVGKPGTPTQILQSKLDLISTTEGEKTAVAPAVKDVLQTSGGNITFRFPNANNLWLQGLSDKKAFSAKDRAGSAGFIFVEQPEKLASLLFKKDNKPDNTIALKNAVKSRKAKVFNLNTKIPIKITYLTSGIEKGILVNNKDVYNLDKALENRMFPPVRGKINKRIPLKNKLK